MSLIKDLKKQIRKIGEIGEIGEKVTPLPELKEDT